MWIASEVMRMKMFHFGKSCFSTSEQVITRLYCIAANSSETTKKSQILEEISLFGWKTENVKRSS